MRAMKAALAAALVLASVSAAAAQPDRVAWGGMASDVVKAVREGRAHVRKSHPRRHHGARRSHKRIHEAARLIGGRPHGCPSRFCGCALSLHLFGRIVPRLNLAANWLGFPRTAPAPGMVAARRGHVFRLIAHRGGSVWRVWDANSGEGRIRIHDRSIAGFAIVNPHGARHG